MTEEERREQARAEAARILEEAGTSQALGLSPPAAPPSPVAGASEAAAAILEEAGTAEALGLRPPTPAAPPPAPADPRATAERDRLVRGQADADRVGAAYRSDLRNVDPNAFRSAAAYQAGVHPDQTEAPTAPPQAAPQRLAGRLARPSPPPPAARPQEAPQGAPVAVRPEGMAAALADPRPQSTRERLLDHLRARRAQSISDPSPPPSDPSPPAEREDPQLAAETPPPAAAADAGPDYTGADWSDAIRRPLHAIGAGLLAAAGRQGTPFRSDRAALEARTERERTASASRAQQAASREMDERRLSITERTLEGQQADREAGREERAERNAVLDARADRQMSEAERRGEVALSMSRAQLSRIESEEAREAAALDPASEPSRTARTALRIALAGYPPDARQRIESEYGSLDELAQRDAEQLMRALPSMFRDLTNRRGGPRGGRGTAARRPPAQLGTVAPEALGTDDDPLVREAVRLGMEPAVAQDMARDARASRTSGRSRLQSMVGGQSMTRGRLAGHAVIAGWERPADATLLTPQESTSLNRITTADREFDTNVRALERELGALTAAERAGGRLAVGSERYYEIQRRLGVIRDQIRSISNAGNSVAAQVHMREEVPDLDANLPVQAILNNVRAAYRVKHDYVEAIMANYSYSRTGGGHGAASAAPAARPRADGRVQMRHPDGRTGWVRPDQVAAARAAGFGDP